MRRHLNLPNQLTILRLLLVPVIGLALAASFTDHYQVAVIVYAAAAATDTLDGRVARSRHQVTELGKFLDPLVDKIMVITVLVILVEKSLLWAWVVVVVFAREFVITGLRSVAAAQGVVISASAWGKSKTLTQNCMIALVILAQPYPMLATPAVVFVYIAVVATVLSGLDYLWRYRGFVV
ncbi:MAG: CDP-diacylglycerol--glycerol-3-phosphate 3-phosphatidyltransferase [Candidatus Dormibacteria bacterium]